MARDLNRLLRPRSIALIGGGAWGDSVIEQAQKMGFDGALWVVHPKAAEVGGVAAVQSLSDLPEPPDACFIGVNRHATVELVGELAKLGAGGAVCFASGFKEAVAEDAKGRDLQDQLLAAAGDMPILGPNCYGFINYLDNALLWPDQHGGSRVERGVALITQSSNIAINMTMQQRGLPIAYTVTCGNMAQTSQAQIAEALLDDVRVTAIGLHVEGFGAIPEWEALAAKAHAKRVPLVVLKAGVSEQAQAATVSHTASLSGSDAGAQALLDRLGIPRVTSPAVLLETLKLMHCAGPLAGNWLSSISCSGGEASLIADMATSRDVTFPPLQPEQETALRDALGPMVALSNPLDYHTYVWGDVPAMTAAWTPMAAPGIDLTLAIVDYPTTDRSAWLCTVEAALAVRAQTGKPFAIVSSLPELMPVDIAQQLMAGGVVPFNGLEEALAATEAATRVRAPHPASVIAALELTTTRTLSEAEAKLRLGRHDVMIPWQCRYRLEGESFEAVMDDGLEHTGDAYYSDVFAVKGEGLAHKSEADAVHLNIAKNDWFKVAQEIGTETVLIEAMVLDPVAELLIGVIRDPVHGFVLTLGAGGVLTELLRDTSTLLLPVTEDDIYKALKTLRIYPLLEGYRGKPGTELWHVTSAVLAVQDYVLASGDAVVEVEINPLICTPTNAVAADALITLGEPA